MLEWRGENGYDLLWAADVMRVVHVWRSITRREQWRIVRVCIFVIIGYSPLLLGDSRRGKRSCCFASDSALIVTIRAESLAKQQLLPYHNAFPP